MTNSSIQSNVIWFSHFFGIDLPQYELPFVDFNLEADVPLYIDPYAISKEPSEFSSICHNSIVDYFQILLSAIRSGEQHNVRKLIRGRFSEPTEIHLGVAKTARKGRGVGKEQEQQIISALSESRAALVGVIYAIQELELHIRGIGPDKISDLLANILLGKFAEYSERVCNDYGVATRPCAVSGFWNDGKKEWDGDYYNLPVFKNHSYILVPKKYVRREKDLINHREFYNKYLLEILERELISANDSLVETLKSGRRRVTKKAMKEDTRFQPSKEFISEFIIQHPFSIERYRRDLQEGFNPTDPSIWNEKNLEDDKEIEELLSLLPNLLPGREHASVYHDTIYDLIKFSFDYALESFEQEFRMDLGRGRIDIIANNYAQGGLFAYLRDAFRASTIPIECKNYTADLGNEEFNQLADRLGPKTSRFGIIFCRNIENHNLVLKHQTDRWLRQDKMMLLIDDDAVRDLIILRLARNFHEIDAYLHRLIRAVEYGSNT